MDGSILHMNSRQQMEQLDFRKRRVMMVGAVCRSLEWMRMTSESVSEGHPEVPSAALSNGCEWTIVVPFSTWTCINKEILL